MKKQGLKLLLELFIVFLGVSGGFFLNNWGIQQDELELEGKYLYAFNQDLDHNILELTNALEKDSLWLVQAEPFLQSFAKDEFIQDSTASLLQLVVQYQQVDIRNGTYTELSYSGNLNLIRDFDLKGEIVQYHLDLDGLKFLDDHLYKYFNEFVMPMMVDEFDMLNAKFIDAKFANTPRFSNVVVGYYSMIQQRLDKYKELLNASLSLKEKM